MEALKDNDAETLDRIAGAVRGRIARVEHVVVTEMRDWEQDDHVIDAIEKAINTMKNTSKYKLIYLNEQIQLYFL